jgi:fructose-1,6-bisphosphatase
VLRLSLRYRRLLQLEEGYGIPLVLLDLLARTVYADDPASSFEVKGTDMRENIMIARVQKAAAIMQFKLEGQVIARHPEWKMEHRRLLRRINRHAGTIFLAMIADGKPFRGMALFEAIESVTRGMIAEKRRSDLNLLWYLWCGPGSPLFGKDRIATLECPLIADSRPPHETKNPYFRLIHEPWFCDKILAEFGVDPEQGLIVNGHVRVEVEKGESPLNRSGKAITIDGAFSEAYGDHGFTLVLEPHRTFLAKRHHFESVEAASSMVQTSSRASRLCANGIGLSALQTVSAADTSGV